MPSPLRGKLIGFLDDLYVLPEVRAAGVINALFNALNQSALDKAWLFVRWNTADNNYRARSFYDKIAERTPWLMYQMPVE